MPDLERYDPALSGRIKYEHYHRYAFACEQISGLTVLDIASGEGYGSAMLARSAAKVVGVDIDVHAVADANARYGQAGKLDYKVGEAGAIPFPDASFEAVVSFETIEHIDNPEALVKEIKRVLKPGGFAIISSPNKSVYNLGLLEPNHFHISEMEMDEFLLLLDGAFKNVAAFGQRMVIASAITPEGPQEAPQKTTEYRGYSVSENGDAAPEAAPTTVHLPSPEYVLCMVSDAPLPQPSGAASMFLMKEHDLWVEHAKIMKWASGLHDEDELLRQELVDLKNQIALSTQSSAADLRLLAPLFEELAGGPLTPDIPHLILLLNRMAVQLATQKLHLDDFDATKSAARGMAAVLEGMRTRLQEAESLLSDREEKLQQASDLATRLNQALDQATRLGIEHRSDELRHAQDALFSETLRARRGEAALKAANSIRIIQDIRRLRADLNVKLKEAANLVATAGLTSATTVSAVAAPAAAKRRSWKGAALAALRGQKVAPEERRDLRVSDTLLKSLFDADYYVKSNKLTLTFGQSPLDHYFAEGRMVGLSTHPLIDAGWIAQTWPEGRFDLASYLVEPDLFARAPHPLFDAKHYLDSNHDVLSAGANPLAHYLLSGWTEGRTPNPLFDSAWYLANNQDVLRAGANPLSHYARYGAGEGRDAHPLFDRGFYLHQNPDVASSGMDPYTHFIAYGRAEGRMPGPIVEQAERFNHLFTSSDGINLLLGPDPSERLKPSAGFWPPSWNSQHQLPQSLRDLIADRYGAEHLDLYTYLFAVIEHYADAPDRFDESEACAALMERAKLLAAKIGDARPTVSIIIPVHNNLLYTLTCIVSVLEIAPAYSFEIIVGDDLSSDRTQEIMERIGGIVRNHRNATNLGFLLNCNSSAEVARGDYLVFLNNDVIVMPGWLDNLISPFKDHDNIGFVGSKLLNGDGTLQEAGGLFWEDGSAWNFGRNSDPALPEFNYLKDTDYVSGASIAVPTRLWIDLQGFDPLFAPAYCEDADLAFRIRKAGLRTVYHPHSVLVHHEGRSHGRDTASGIKAYQVVNQRKFLDRWGDTLRLENLPAEHDVFLARDRSAKKPHILIIDHYVPQWDRDAGSRTVFLYIKMFLKRGFAVTFWPDNLHEDREYSAPLQAMGVEVIYHADYVGRFPKWIAENGKHFDYALICRPHIAEKYIDEINSADDIKTIYYGVDLHCKRLEASYALSKEENLLVEAAKWEKIERAICEKSDIALYPGLHEVDVVKTWVTNDTTVLNFPITIFTETELADGLANIEDGINRDPYSLMFVGGFTHNPNIGGTQWFVQEVMPLLVKADARFNIRIAGSNVPEEITALASDNVTILGRVSDDELMKLYRTSAFAVVPLLYGAGVKGKVIEAMARGTPVVMTSVGAQGIEDAKDLAIVEDDAARMASLIITAAANRSNALLKAQAAIDFIRRWYSEEAVTTLLTPHMPELSRSTR